MESGLCLDADTRLSVEEGSWSETLQLLFDKVGHGMLFDLVVLVDVVSEDELQVV
jgi:hypothetical protein